MNSFTFLPWILVIILIFSGSWADESKKKLGGGSGKFALPSNVATTLKNATPIKQFLSDSEKRLLGFAPILYASAKSKSDIQALTQAWSMLVSEQRSALQVLKKGAEKSLVRKSGDWMEIVLPWLNKVQAGFIKLQGAERSVEEEAQMDWRLITCKVANTRNIRLVKSWEKRIAFVDACLDKAKKALASGNKSVVQATMPAVNKGFQYAKMLQRCAIRDQRLIAKYLRNATTAERRWKASRNLFKQVKVTEFPVFGNKGQEFSAHAATQYKKVIKIHQEWREILNPLYESTVLKKTKHMQGWELTKIQTNYHKVYQELKKQTR